MKKTFILIAALCMAATAFAQSEDTRKQVAYVGVNGGAQVFNGVNDSRLSFGDRIAPVFGVTGGVWLAPAFAVDANFTYAKFEGVYGYPVLDQHFQTGEMINNDKYSFYQRGWYYQFDLNFHLDLNTAIWGYRADRKNHLVPYAGIGVVASAESEDCGAAPALNLGLQYKYNFTPNWGLFADFKSSWTNKALEKETCQEHILHNAYGLRLGVTYTFLTK